MSNIIIFTKLYKGFTKIQKIRKRMITVNIKGKAIPKNPKIHQLVPDRNGSKQVTKKGIMQIILTKKIMRRVISKKFLPMKCFASKL